MSALNIYLVGMISDLRVIFFITALLLLAAIFWVAAAEGGKLSITSLVIAFLLLFTGSILPSRQTLAEMFLVPRLNAGLSTEGMPPELAAVWHKFCRDYLDGDLRVCRREKNGHAGCD